MWVWASVLPLLCSFTVIVASLFSRVSTLVLVWPALLDNGMFSLIIHSAGHVWIWARFPKTREWSSDWTEQEVSFGFCLRQFDKIPNVCSWVHSESWTACLDANKIQQVHSHKVNIKKKINCIKTCGCVLLWCPFPAELVPIGELALHGCIMFGVRMESQIKQQNRRCHHAVETLRS